VEINRHAKEVLYFPRIEIKEKGEKEIEREKGRRATNSR